MIISLSATKANGERLEIPMARKGYSSGLVIVSVKGLGPPTAVVNTIGGPTQDGSRFNYSKVNNRNIVLSMALMHSQTEDTDPTRLSLYEYFPIGGKLIFGVETDTRSVEIDAYVESNTVNHFNKHENVEISLLCPAPYFKNPEVSTANISSVVSNFTFPFLNDSLTEPLLIFGYVRDYFRLDISYGGDVDTGAIFAVQCTDETGDILIYNENHGETYRIYGSMVEYLIGDFIRDGDIVLLDTRDRQKSLLHTRGGVTTNILNAMDLSSDWPRLYPGSNLLSYHTSSSDNNYGTEMVVYYQELYQGV